MELPYLCVCAHVCIPHTHTFVRMYVSVCLVLLSWRAIRVSIGIRHQNSPIWRPPTKTNTSYKAWDNAASVAEDALDLGADLSPAMRASSSTCRVLTINWHVRGMCHCLWQARGLCLCPCATAPRGFTSLPTQEVEFGSSGCILTNKQTNKQTHMSWGGILQNKISLSLREEKHISREEDRVEKVGPLLIWNTVTTSHHWQIPYQK